MIATELTGVVAEHIAAVNAMDTDAIVATFAEDAYVNDARREFAGIEAIRRWVAREMVGDKVRIDVREVLDHHGDIIVRGAYDGEFDKANLPEEVILSNYFSVRDGKIVSLVVIFNQPASVTAAVGVLRPRPPTSPRRPQVWRCRRIGISRERCECWGWSGDAGSVPVLS